jgi:hypothetical protein
MAPYLFVSAQKASLNQNESLIVQKVTIRMDFNRHNLTIFIHDSRVMGKKVFTNIV